VSRSEGIGEALAWLDAHANFEATGLPVRRSEEDAQRRFARVQRLVELLGSPHAEYPVLHVTGTNGKTSVSRLATGLLVELGLSVGTYTSPHLERVNERIAWNGAPIDDESLAALLRTIADVEVHLDSTPAYFEILTSAAFEHFADVAVEAAVVEVGVGGRLDPTNVVDAAVAVVTNVSVDHVDYLGPTRESIATEKAGIAAAGTGALVLGETDPSLRAIFEARDAERLVLRDRDFGVLRNDAAHGGRVVSLFTPEARYDDLFLSLHGAHQADNAAIALAAVEAFLERPVDPDVVASVLGTIRSPGRLEVVGHQPLVLLDGAHNVAGAQHLVAALAEEFPPSPRVLVVGLLGEKDPDEMLGALGAGAAAHVVCCRAPSPRTHDAATLAAAAVELGLDRDRVWEVDDVADALDRARELATPEGQVVVSGSLYVVGAARAALGGLDR
jgi:dihydrofolate synthase/folylpolyglutamate synthase